MLSVVDVLHNSDGRTDGHFFCCSEETLRTYQTSDDEVMLPCHEPMITRNQKTLEFDCVFAIICYYYYYFVQMYQLSIFSLVLQLNLHILQKRR